MHNDDASNLLKGFSRLDLARLGLGGIGYIRTVQTEDGPGYAVYAADGTELAESLDNIDDAMDLIQVHDLRPVSVH